MIKAWVFNLVPFSALTGPGSEVTSFEAGIGLPDLVDSSAAKHWVG